MIENVEPRPLLDDRKERDHSDARHKELRDRDDAGSGPDDAGDEVEEDDERKEDGDALRTAPARGVTRP